MAPCAGSLCAPGSIKVFKKIIKRNLYLLKDICKLAQNVFLQALERGDAAGERQSRRSHSHIWNNPKVVRGSKHEKRKKSFSLSGNNFFLSNLTQWNQSCDISCSKALWKSILGHQSPHHKQRLHIWAAATGSTPVCFHFVPLPPRQQLLHIIASTK